MMMMGYEYGVLVRRMPSGTDATPNPNTPKGAKVVLQERRRGHRHRL